MRAAHAWRRWWPAVLAAVVLYGIWALTLAATEEPVRAGAAPKAMPAATVTMVSPIPAVRATTAAPVVAAAVVTGVPPGVSAEQWAAIQAEVARRPDAATVLQRLRD